jgi:Tfp pilus assembly protein PilX
VVMNLTTCKSQKGAVLLVSLIMLMLFTVMMAGLFSRSNTTIKAVSNMQMRSQALSAANFAVEQIISSDFTAAPQAEAVIIDINNDNVTDYTASIDAPLCIRAYAASGSSPSSVSLPGLTSTNWNTVWEIVSTVSDDVSGSFVRVRAGVNVVLTDAEKTAVCS